MGIGLALAKGTTMQRDDERYLEIINHIVTRRADEEREARARGEGKERLHGLI